MFKNFLIAAWSFIKKYKWIVASASALVVIGVVSLIIVVNRNISSAVPTAAAAPKVSSIVSSETSSAASSEVTSSSEASSSSEVSSSSEATSSAAHTHKWVKGKTVAPTTTSKGYTNYSCSCGKTKQDDWVPKLEKKIDIPRPAPGPIEKPTEEDKEEDEETGELPDGTYRKSGTDENGKYLCVAVKANDHYYAVVDYRENHDDLTTKVQSNGVLVQYTDNSFVLKTVSDGCISTGIIYDGYISVGYFNNDEEYIPFESEN